jgi:hypothetical protein
MWQRSGAWLAHLTSVFAGLRKTAFGAAGVTPDGHVSRWLFLRLLGIVYAAAFVSLWVQIDGLIGSRGILPSARFLQAVEHALGAEAYWRLPTLCWLLPGDSGLHALCGAGVIMSALLILGVAPGPALLGLWASYLSLTIAGQIFRHFSLAATTF